MTICGSGQYLGLVERELYRNFTEWNKEREDVTNQTVEEEATNFREFIGKIYEIKNGTNLLDILSTMLSPDLEATAATTLVKHQQQCSKNAVLSRKKRTTTNKCLPIIVVEELVYSKDYLSENALYLAKSETVGNYWLGRDWKTDYFVLDLGCNRTFSGVQLVNTHNQIHRDRSTKKFR